MSDRLFRRGPVWWCWGWYADGKRWRASTRQHDREAALVVAAEIARAKVGVRDEEWETIVKTGQRAKRRVYFMQAGGPRGPVKIGVAVDPVQRLYTIQCHNHEEVVIRATMPGGAAVEKLLHMRHSLRRLRGEWFHWCVELEADRGGVPWASVVARCDLRGRGFVQLQQSGRRDRHASRGVRQGGGR